jgi:hypothetical protein
MNGAATPTLLFSHKVTHGFFLAAPVKSPANRADLSAS